MATKASERNTAGRTFAVLAALIAISAISLLTYNVAREISLLSSAKSDNIQWSLAQTQVEFLNYQEQLNMTPVELSTLRREFDVFYSRIATIREAQVFDIVRQNPTSQDYLSDVSAFLVNSVPIIDASDAEIIQELTALQTTTADIRPVVRALSNSGLDIFAEKSDNQRQAVARTMMQLAIAIATLIGALALTVWFLNRLNASISRREQEKNQTSERMNTVMGTSLDGVIVTDYNGQIIEFNPAAETIFGHRKLDVLGLDIIDLIIPKHIQNTLDLGGNRGQTNDKKRVVGQGRVKLEAKHFDGSVFPVELAVQSAKTDQGEIYIAFIRDISRRVAAEAELVMARDKALAGEKLKTDFLATMSHEIRTPLNGLLGNMSLLRDTHLDTAQDRFVGYMETSGRLLMNHISDVLDITRYDAGKLDTRLGPVNISALLQDIVDNQSSAASKHETSLTWKWLSEETSWILSDHDRLQHVMINLIGNAVKFTKHGHVDITVQEIDENDNPTLQIQIKDTGPGMSEDLVKSVFDDFVTGDTSYDRDVGGTGLGLSIAKRFVNALGGDIRVESKAGVGSTFWVTLPLIPTKAPAISSETKPMKRSDVSLKVLLVEDNEINRIVASEMLQANGHTVALAHNGEEGAQAALKTKYDLILMDISMPVMDGRTATRLIRSQGSESAKTRIVALTANAMPEEQEEFLKDGMNAILTKPLSREALNNLLDDISSDKPNDMPPMVDHSHSAEARDALGEDAFAKLRAHFMGEVDTLHDWFSTDAPQDLLEVAEKSHKVAGSAAVFGADRLRESLKVIERAAKEGDSDIVEAEVAGLDAIWAQTKAELISHT